MLKSMWMGWLTHPTSLQNKRRLAEVKKLKNIAIIPNDSRDEGLVETKRVVEILRSYKANIFAERKFQGVWGGDIIYGETESILREADAAVVLGGDGTILNIAPQAAMYGVPIVGMNLGNLGFLSQAEKGDYSIFESLFSDSYSVTSCMMLDAVIVKKGVEGKRFLALNEVVAAAGGASKMINVTAAVNGTNIGSYSADGLIVATAVGSTAYSLSAGGAVLHPDLDAMIITPICPHTLTARSMVVPGNDEIWISPAKPYRSQMSILVDGETRGVLENDEFIKITKSKYRTRLIKPEGRNFFDVLREKLSD